MSPFTTDLIKIVLDRGLLGGVATLLAYYGSRLLERYKAHNIYQQQLSARRLQAYEDLGEYIYGGFKHLKMMFHTIRDARTGEKAANQETVKAVNESWAELMKSMEASESRFARNLMFVSPQSGAMLMEFFAGMSRFLDTLLRPAQHQEPFDQLVRLCQIRS